MRAWFIAILAAAVLHVAILLFGGIFFMDPAEETAEVREVDLLALESEEPEQEPEEQEAEPPPELETETPEAPPEMPEMAEPPPQVTTTDVVGRLEALSLGALEGALDASGGADGFGGNSASLTSGGQIGGTGALGAGGGLDESSADAIFDIGALDQAPRVLHQAAPVYPPELRRRKIEGTVYVVFVVDQQGRVVDPSVETAPDEAFHAPALEAVRRWRFEPAVIRGEKVRSKLRIPIRFSLNT